MGASTKIRLPLHVSSEHIMEVIGKSVGVPWELNDLHKAERGHAPCDFSQPSAKGNAWHVRFLGGRENLCIKQAESGRDMGFGHIIFTDLAGEEYSWAFFQETEFEDHKLVSPGSSALGVAIGRRLVNFFGGDVQYDDNLENVAPYRRSPRSATYPPPPRRVPGQAVNSDIRWYLFQNALAAVPLISVKELLWASKRASYGLTDRGEGLLARLQIEEQTKALKDRVAHIAPAPARSGPRL